MYDCGSEPAREKPEAAAGHQTSRVIVDDHREQARSYSPPNALRSDRRTQSQDNAPSFFSAVLHCGLSDVFACLAALA
ncbi:hypothetical protein EMIT0194P_50224 [Pseudomonas serbica]